MSMTFMKESQIACHLNFLWPNRGHITYLFMLINQGEWIINVRKSTQRVMCWSVTQYCVDRHLPILMLNVPVNVYVLITVSFSIPLDPACF